MLKNKKLIGIAGLILASFFWGAEFVVEKDVLSSVSPNYSNAIRFAIASMICTVFFIHQIKKMTLEDLTNGCITGGFMGFGFAFQTMGLNTINAGENALLCSSYILMIPFAQWIFLKKKPGMNTFVCATIALTGVFLISSNGNIAEFSFSIGEIYTLIGAIFYSGAIITISRLSLKTDSRLLTLLQLYIIAVISIIFAILLEKAPTQFTASLVVEFIYLILFATIGAQILMNLCIKYVTSSTAGMIFSTEAFFATVLGVIILKEVTGLALWIGTFLIIGSIIFIQIEEDRKTISAASNSY